MTPKSFYIGDDWNIVTDLPDYAPLAGKLIGWTLATHGSLNQVVGSQEVFVEILDSERGAIRIHVPHTVTCMVPPGRYHDAVTVYDPTLGENNTLIGDLHVLATGMNSQRMPH